MVDEISKKYCSTKFLLTLFSLISEAANQQGIPDEQSQLIAENSLQALIAEHGGKQVYFPTGFGLKKAILHQKIRADFDGSNQGKLAQKYQLSVTQIYNITRNEK